MRLFRGKFGTFYNIPIYCKCVCALFYVVLCGCVAFGRWCGLEWLLHGCFRSGVRSGGSIGGKTANTRGKPHLLEMLKFRHICTPFNTKFGANSKIKTPYFPYGFKIWLP